MSMEEVLLRLRLMRGLGGAQIDKGGTITALAESAQREALLCVGDQLVGEVAASGDGGVMGVR